ncbi:MAG: hypothetical protein ABIN36_18745 [Ferruginibacter sp.]
MSGQLIFDTNDVSSGWDGTYKGSVQNIGTYSWMLEATDIKCKLWKLHGTVVLIR